MKSKQLKQDEEYSFPYHYIPQYREGFSQHLTWDWSKNYVSAIEFLINEIKKNKSEIVTIADIGCGDGRLTRELFLEFQDMNIMGVDYSERAINLAMSLNPEIKFYNKDIINEPFDKRVDAITLIEVFEHIPIEICHSFVNSLSNILNDKGLLYITVPHKNVILSNKHEQHFDLNIIKSYFDKFFDIEEVMFIQKAPFLLKIINKLLSNRYFTITANYINNIAYSYYKKSCFYSDESDCQRIYLRLRKKY